MCETTETRIKTRRLTPGIVLAALAVVVLAPTLAQAFPDTVWVRRYDGPDNLSDFANMVVVDQEGNSYVTGGSETPTNGFDWATVKYLPNGDTAWVRRANGGGNDDDRAYALAVDRFGNVIVTGHTTSMGGHPNFRTIKYDADGDLVYIKEYDGADHLSDLALALAIDSAGNAYVVGYTETASNGYDWMVIKYLPNGDTAYTRQADGWGDDNDIPRAVAVDRFGNVIVTGYTTNLGNNINTGTIKFDPDGNVVYVKEYDGPAHGIDDAFALGLDTAGNAYITGASQGAGGFDYFDFDYVTVKYLPNGDTAWVRRYNGTADSVDFAYAIAIDPAGNALVTGFSAGAGSQEDWLTIKYLPNGDTVWTRRANGSANSTDIARGVAVGSSGDVFVTGFTTSFGGNINYRTIRYLADGSLSWVREYDGTTDDTDIAQSVAVDPAGNVFVTGYSWGSGTDYDYATIKYAAAGGIEESRRTLAADRRSGPGIVSGSLWLAASQDASLLLDAAGRKVLKLRPGANDVRGLAPGVYFIRTGPSAARRVVILP